MLPFLWRRTSDEVVENVEIPLSTRGTGDTVPLKVILESLDTAESATFRKLELCVFSETGSVGVEEGTGIAERLEDKL